MTNLSRGVAFLGGVMPNATRYLVAIGGAAAVAYGAYLFAAPLGFVVGGVLLIAGAVLDHAGAQGVGVPQRG